MKKFLYFFILALFILACTKKEDDNTDNPEAKELSIFFINDPHAQIYNFAKIKHIVETEKEHRPVIVACAGDIFSGNPVVDYYPEKGYPVIDIMNQVGFDISAVGNHEFDYGEEITGQRFEQAEFKWVCANVDMNNTGVPEPLEYYTIERNDLRITFLGLVETNGKENATIPSTHPFKVKNYTFERPENVVGQFADIKNKENADLYIALTHLGYNVNYGMGDFHLAEMHPYFDLIIGGHTHSELNDNINGIYFYNAGSHLHKLGKVELVIYDKKIVNEDYELINLAIYPEADNAIESAINQYYESMATELEQIIGYSHRDHNKSQVGCFYTDALRIRTETDICFQNTGGIRAGLWEGDISVGDVYAIDPFNNGTMIYEMSIGEIKTFLKGTGSGFYYSGVDISQEENGIVIRDLDNNIIPDAEVIKLGINDYIPAVHDVYFPANGDVQEYTTAEAIVYYLKHINSEVDYADCGRYFKYNN
jgi:2',3'-cyclic-nucleotide 2'-phosphodiesterase (5'-nucleotidase family)